MEKILVIGYGNPLRSDDGVAWLAAEQLRHELPDARIVCVQQLTPELAEDVASADVVVFLDASFEGEPGTVVCEPVVSPPNQPQLETLRFSHHLTPSRIIALSDRLYSAKPRAFLVSINGANLDHGQRLSPFVADAVPEVVAHVLGLSGRPSLERESERPAKVREFSL